MKHLKYFENKNKNIEIGDYVLLKCENVITDNKELDEYIKFLNTNIGIVSKYVNNYVDVSYQNVPTNVRKFLVYSKKSYIVPNTHVSMIKYYGKTKESVEIQISSEKYNI